MPYAFGAAAGGKTYPQYFITKSQTWVPPEDGNICIHVIGGGGSGAVGSTVYGAGAAGAYGKIASLAVTTAGSFTLVVGSGGTKRWGNNGVVDGVSGGNSTIAGTGITGTLTCGGGEGGIQSSAANAGGGAVSGSANEGWAGFSGGIGVVTGGAVGVYATGAHDTGTDYIGARTDAPIGGILMSRYGTICGGERGGNWASNMNGSATRLAIHGEDLCGGGYAYTSVGVNSFSGNGGIGAGAGGCKGNNYIYLHSGYGGHGIILIQYLPG